MSGEDLDKKLKEVEDNMFQFEKDFGAAIGNIQDYTDKRKLSYVHNGLKALYLQNKILIEQNQEIIKYLENKK